MFGIDSSELMLIAIVALVVIGPKELPGLLRTWGRWMAQMRGMASEFRGHVDEMVRQSDLDEVKKQLTASSGLDLQSLDPTKEIRSHIQEGMAEGEKAIAEGKSVFDNPLAEPESAPQIAVETPAETSIEAAAEPVPAVAETPPVVTAEEAPVPGPAPVPVPPAEPVQEKPAKAAAE
ncbi:MAG TPA: Sec-independent protein translocase protein TatB [Reyranella sp.]|jgi:sec-independent protein translocase protein TatB